MFLIAVALIWLATMVYQLRLQRKIDLWRDTESTVGPSTVEDWAAAARHLARDLTHVVISPHPASPEFAASLAAIRGASVVLLLWLTKLVAVFLADHALLSLVHSRLLFRVMASLACVSVVWQTISAFWSAAKESWRSLRTRSWVLLVIMAIVSSVLVNTSLADGAAVDAVPWLKSSWPWAFGAALLLGLSLHDGMPRNVDASFVILTRWRRLPALLALAAFLAFAFDLIFMNWDSIDALLYADRTASIGELISPAAPVLLFSLAMFWWGAWNVRRLQILNLPEGTVGIGSLLCDRARAAGIDPALLQQPTLSLGYYIVLPSVAALIALTFGRHYVGSIDGRFFDGFLLFGGVSLATVLLHALAHAMHLGRAVVLLLHSLACHPASSLFETLGKEPVPWRITYRETLRSALEPLRRRLAGLGRGLEALNAANPDVPPELIAARRDLLTRNAAVTSRLAPHEDSRVIGRPLDLADWRSLDELIRPFADILQDSRWGSAATDKATADDVSRVLDEMEYVVVFHAALILRDLLMRLVSGFTMVIGGALMLALAHLLYSFEGRVFWLTFDAAVIAVSAAISVRLLVILERDSILSTLWRTAPGKVSLFGGLTWRMVVYGTASLVTIFAALFPELGGQLIRWVVPAKALLS